MLAFTLLKNLYYELDPVKMPDSRETRRGGARFRLVPLHLPETPEFTELIAEERYVPYGSLYYFYINDDRSHAELTDLRSKRFLLSFYRTLFPNYLKEEYRAGFPLDDSPETAKLLSSINILDCFEVDHMPGYDRGYAYHEILTVEDLRAGKTEDEHKPKTAFPGMTFTDKYRPK